MQEPDTSNLHRYRITPLERLWRVDSNAPRLIPANGSLIVPADPTPEPTPEDHQRAASARPVIHRRFADIRPDNTKRALSFADSWGLLGLKRYRTASGETGELLEDWLVEAEKLFSLTRLWQRLNLPMHPEAEMDPVAACLREMSTQGRYNPYKQPPDDPDRLYSGMERVRDLVPILFDPSDNYRPREPRLAATDLLEYELRTALAAATGFAIEFGFKRIEKGLLEAKFQPVARTIRDELYLSFAIETLGGSRPPIRCAGCDKWILPKHARQTVCEGPDKWRCQKRAQRRDPLNRSKSPVEVPVEVPPSPENDKSPLD